MAITLITGPANAGKARLVMDAVRAHVARGEEPLLILPRRADADHYRRELAQDGVVMGVAVEPFAGLIGEVVLRAGTGEPVIGTAARQELLAAIAASSALGGGAPQAATPVAWGLVRALGELFAELQVRRVAPGRLKGALMQWAALDPAARSHVELGGLFERYRQTLGRLGRSDAEQRSVQALDELRRRPGAWGARPVLLYGFDDLTRLQIDVIETLGRVVGAEVTVSLRYEPGRTAFAGRAGTFAALLPLAAEHRELPARAEYYAPRSRAALSHLERSLFELDAALLSPAGAVRLLEAGGERAELELIAEELRSLLAGGMAAEEIALVARRPEAMADLLGEVFSAAGIPFSLQRRRRFADTAIGRALIGVLRCVPAIEGAEGAAGAAGELGDLLAWLRAPGLLTRAEAADSLEIRARRSGALSAAQARALWEERHWRLDAIDQLQQAQGRGAAALIERATRELEWLFCAPRRGGAEVLSAQAAEEAGALAAGRRALGELRELARLAPELAVADAAALARSLERVEFHSGEGPAAGAVAVLDPLALRARRVRALFLCGLQEGVFPARPRPASLLSEEERRSLAESSGLRLGEHQDALAAERYLLYAAVSRPEELLVLSSHRANDDGEPTPRSLFVDDVCDLFAGRLGGEAQAPSAPAIEPALTPAAASRALPEAISSELLLAEMRLRPWSASSLESWIGCPVKWFIERMLRPGALDPDPEPFARGGLAHAALKDTLEGLRSETGSALLTPASVGRARELLRRSLQENESSYPLSVAAERRPGVRRRLRADLERYLEHAVEACSALEPTYLELGFGFQEQDEESLPALDLGGEMRMRGRIDRVDIGPGGEAVVYDYKSKVAPPAAKWIGEGKIQVALYMRAVEELLGVEVVGGFYQPLSGSDLRARGVLDSDSGLELDCVSTDAREPAEMRELVAEAVAMGRVAAAEAGRGEVSARPASCAYDGGCAYPTICRCER